MQRASSFMSIFKYWTTSKKNNRLFWNSTPFKWSTLLPTVKVLFLQLFRNDDFGTKVSLELASGLSIAGVRIEFQITSQKGKSGWVKYLNLGVSQLPTFFHQASPNFFCSNWIVSFAVWMHLVEAITRQDLSHAFVESENAQTSIHTTHFQILFHFVWIIKVQYWA